MKHFLLAILLASGFALVAQPDAYHQALIANLSVQYTLTGETYPFYDSEAEYQSNGISYGLTETTGMVSGEEFTQFTNLDVPGGLDSRFSAGWSINNEVPIAMGDKLLWVVYLRHKPTPDGNATGRVGLFAQRNDNFEKDFELIVDVNENWQRYLIRMEIVTRNHPTGGFNLGLHVGFQEQDIQLGGMAIMNYGSDMDLTQLPQNLNAGDYGGFEEDAPWRAEAAQRIDSLRKADMMLTVLDTDGSPLANTDVSVRMQQHQFKFGTAVKGSRFFGGREYNQTYVRKLFDLDGEGHGFNAMVFENDLKWPAWEQEWITLNPQLRRAIDYLFDRGIHLRGHVLLWPGFDNMPNRMRENQGNPDYLKTQIDDHLVQMLETENFDVKVPDWDVLNEINTNTDLAAALRGTPGYPTGREIYAEVFKRARELAPDASLYINDYITLSLQNEAGNSLYDQYIDYIGEIIAADAPIDGVGFQGHIGASPNSIYKVEDTFDDFYTRFGLEAKVTEFDLPRNVDPEIAPRYLRDFLTMTFSHPSMTGFMFWNFWDVDTWANPGANLYTEDWTEKPSHTAFTNLVFDEWWTNEELTTDVSGLASMRGFKGEYEITLTCNDTAVTTSVNLSDNVALTLDCEQLLSSTRLPALPIGTVTASPNPGSGPLQLTNTLPMRLDAELFDTTGRRIWFGNLDQGTHAYNFELVPGVYQLHFTDGRRQGTLKLLRQQ